jgi:hypothetical protein
MRLKRPNTAVAVVVSLVVSVSACLVISPVALAQSQLANMGPTETRMPNMASVRYDTQYKSSNEGVIAFDDGQVTRIQLPPGTLVPAFFAVRAQGDVLLTPKQSATYFVVEGVHAKLNLVWANNKQVAITYMGSVTTERMGTAAAFGAAAPKSVHASAAKPADVALPVKAMSSDEVKAVPSLAIAEVGGNTAASAATNLARSQVATSVAEAVVPSAPVIAKPALTWKVELKDVYIANTLQRWASGQGWRVKWDAAKNFVVEAPDSYVGTFEDAVTALLSAPGIQNSRYPVDVCFYPNTPPLARVTLRGEQDKECK